MTEPYGFSFDTTKYNDGNATIKATAYDPSGNYTTQSIIVKVSNVSDTIPPTVSISSPTNGSYVDKKNTIRATAVDNIGVTQMSIYIDGQLVSNTSSSSIAYNWNANRASKGRHVILVKARDNAGNESSDSIVVNK